jgi:hypothetical protein
MTTLNNQEFKFVCEVCGSLTIKIAHPVQAPGTTIVECGRYNSPRGTLVIFVILPGRGQAETLPPPFNPG